MYTTTYTVYCEDCDEYLPLPVSNVKEARERAREQGWSSPSYGQFRCPDCRMHDPNHS